MRQIFDHRETDMGLCRLARTVGESVGERWRDGASSLPALGIRSHRCLHPYWRGQAVDGTYFGPSRNGDAGLHRLPRAQSARVWESDGATARAVCRPWVTGLTDACTHVVAPAVDGADFGPSRNGNGAASAATHSLRECGRAMARRRGQFAYDWLPVPPMFCTHMHGKLM